MNQHRAGLERDLLLTEVLAQPLVLRRAGEAVLGQLEKLRRLAGMLSRDGNGQPPSVVLTGMGSSLDACRSAASLLAEAGLPAFELEAAELLHFRLPALNRHPTMVMVSQSGKSAELIAVARAARMLADPPLLIGVTNGLENPLAHLVDVAFDAGVGEERGPATGSFGGSLVALAAVSAVLVQAPGFDRSIMPGVEPKDPEAIAMAAADAANDAADSAARLLTDPESLGRDLAGWLRGFSSVVTLGRGVGWAAASMASLTLKEIAGLHAEPARCASFRHGPMEIAGPGLAAIVFALEPSTRALEVRLADDLLRLGAGVLWLGPARSGPPGAVEVTLEPVDRIVAPAPAIVPIQLLARQIALDDGRIPGIFRQASKVTLTE